ncbi:MAG: hypothetical protein EZS28_004843 [Streblomastix strix]|uniref:Dynein heavy chain 3 AAA+ lid domain-containing protein n=1 Tax=Streblomastix strix TaxID=222440 RepID=A0A5J4WX52_9EUKA|nr:MAG: hypothetical protein EZS28_004843 [Streblomastix strix]
MGYICVLSFVADKKQLTPLINKFSVESCQFAMNVLRKPLSKSHYVFNLRDLSKVFKGIMQIKVIDKIEELQISRLYVFELLLFISAIITNDEYRNIFSQQIVSLAKQHIHINWKYDIMFEKKVVKECPFELEYRQTKDDKAEAGKEKEYDQSKQFPL